MKQFAIIANPASGSLLPDEKRAILKAAANVLNAKVFGLDCQTVEAFRSLARDVAREHAVLVVAGGDGSFSEIINVLDTRRQTLAFLPMGSGNALRHALQYRNRLADIAEQIKARPTRFFDLIDCSGRRRAFMVSLGFDVAVLQHYAQRRSRRGKTYTKDVLHTLFARPHSFSATIGVDHMERTLDNLFNVMVVKQPFYGYGLHLVPGANWDDGQLHLRFLKSEWLKIAWALTTAFTVGNRVGPHLRGHHITVTLSNPQYLQIDGDLAWKSDRFHFRVLPRALRIKG